MVYYSLAEVLYPVLDIIYGDFSSILPRQNLWQFLCRFPGITVPHDKPLFLSDSTLIKTLSSVLNMYFNGSLGRPIFSSPTPYSLSNVCSWGRGLLDCFWSPQQFV